MKVVCLNCSEIDEPVFYVSVNGTEGGICRGCELKASSRIEILVIEGRPFTRTLKQGPVAVVPARKVKRGTA